MLGLCLLCVLSLRSISCSLYQVYVCAMSCIEYRSVYRSFTVQRHEHLTALTVHPSDRNRLVYRTTAQTKERYPLTHVSLPRRATPYDMTRLFALRGVLTRVSSVHRMSIRSASDPRREPRIRAHVVRLSYRYSDKFTLTSRCREPRPGVVCPCVCHAQLLLN